MRIFLALFPRFHEISSCEYFTVIDFSFPNSSRLSQLYRREKSSSSMKNYFHPRPSYLLQLTTHDFFTTMCKSRSHRSAATEKFQRRKICSLSRVFHFKCEGIFDFSLILWVRRELLNVKWQQCELSGGIKKRNVKHQIKILLNSKCLTLCFSIFQWKFLCN